VRSRAVRAGASDQPTRYISVSLRGLASARFRDHIFRAALSAARPLLRHEFCAAAAAFGSESAATQSGPAVTPRCPDCEEGILPIQERRGRSKRMASAAVAEPASAAMFATEGRRRSNPNWPCALSSNTSGSASPAEIRVRDCLRQLQGSVTETIESINRTQAAKQ